MLLVLTIAVAAAALVLGYEQGSWLWALGLALGYFVDQIARHRSQLRDLASRGHFGVAIFMLGWLYSGSVIAMLIPFGLGRAMGWTVRMLL